jgi:hypothetical protein
VDTPGQRWQDFGITSKGRERAKGFITALPKAYRGADAVRIRDEIPRQLDWCHARGIVPTTRFLAYRTAGALGLPHGTLGSIQSHIAVLRRSVTGGIPMNAVRDARSTSVTQWTVTADEGADEVEELLDGIRAHRQDGQPNRVVFICEADGTVPVLEDVCDEFGVEIHSGSGSVPLSLVHRLATDAVAHFRDTGIRTVILSLTDLDLMGLKNILAPFAQDVEKFAVDYGNPEAVEVRRIGVTADQVLDHIPASVRMSREKPEAWWPRDRNGDAWELPTAEALLDVMPGIVRAAFEVLLPDEAQRRAMVDTEDEMRAETAREVVRRLTP